MDCFVEWLTDESALIFYDRGPCQIEANPLICRVNQWSGFCMKGISVMKELSLSYSCYSCWRFPSSYLIKGSSLNFASNIEQI